MSKFWSTFNTVVTTVTTLVALVFGIIVWQCGQREKILEERISANQKEADAQISKCQSGAGLLRQEIEQLKGYFRETREEVEVTPVRGAEAPSRPGEAPVPADAYEVYLSSGNSTPLFGGALKVSLGEIRFEPDPAGYRADIVLEAAGQPQRSLKGIADAFALPYGPFEFVVDRVEPTGARLRITRRTAP